MKRIVILGGGTNTYISNHLALSAPAYGTTAKHLYRKFLKQVDSNLSVELCLTKMADPSQDYLDTPEDVEALVDRLIADSNVRVIVFNVAMVDYKPVMAYGKENGTISSGLVFKADGDKDFGKYVRRISTGQVKNLTLILEPYKKIIQKIRKERKDIFLVGFKTTCGSEKEVQYNKGLKLLKDSSCNLVFVNDVDKDRIKDLESLIKLNNNPELIQQDYYQELYVKYSGFRNCTKRVSDFIKPLQNNGIVTPEESSYWYNTREEALDSLVQMTLDRINSDFGKSIVVESEVIPWNTGFTRELSHFHYVDRQGVGHSASRLDKKTYIPNPLIPETFRYVFEHIRANGGWHEGPTGNTSGHYGFKLNEYESICSIRKRNYNNIEEVGMVKVITGDPNNTYGYKKDFITKEELEQLDLIDTFLNQFPKENPKSLYPYSSMYEGIPFDNRKALLVFYENLLEKSKPKVIAFGAKPSVGDVTQRALFKQYPEYDCIIHFHSELREEFSDYISRASQFSFECGGVSCGINTTNAMKKYEIGEGHAVMAVHLDLHGPNIMFKKETPFYLINDFISKYWIISRKTNGV